MKRDEKRPPGEPLLTTAAVAALLQVHPKHVYRLVRRGLPGRRVGGEWRFVRAEVLAWAGASGEAASRDGGDEEQEREAPRSEVARPLPLIAAAGDVVIEILLGVANAEGPPLFGFVQADRGQATSFLRRAAVLAAGSHGDVPPARLDGVRLARLHLVSREVGIAGAPGKPVPRLSRLARVRFASRPRTAGIVVHLEHALRHAGVDGERVAAGARLFDSHREVVFAILRGDADAGLCTRAWAERVGLPFETIATESYGLLLRAADLGDALAVRLCEAAQGAAYRDAVAAVPGYDVTGAGDIRYDPEPARPSEAPRNY